MIATTPCKSYTAWHKGKRWAFLYAPIYFIFIPVFFCFFFILEVLLIEIHIQPLLHRRHPTLTLQGGWGSFAGGCIDKSSPLFLNWSRRPPPIMPKGVDPHPLPPVGEEESIFVALFLDSVIVRIYSTSARLSWRFSALSLSLCFPFYLLLSLVLSLHLPFFVSLPLFHSLSLLLSLSLPLCFFLSPSLSLSLALSPAPSLSIYITPSMSFPLSSGPVSLCWQRYASSVTFIGAKSEVVETSSNSGLIFYIHFHTNARWKGMDRFLLHLPMG